VKRLYELKIVLYSPQFFECFRVQNDQIIWLGCIVAAHRNQNWKIVRKARYLTFNLIKWNRHLTQSVIFVSSWIQLRYESRFRTEFIIWWCFVNCGSSCLQVYLPDLKECQIAYILCQVLTQFTKLVFLAWSHRIFEQSITIKTRPVKVLVRPAHKPWVNCWSLNSRISNFLGTQNYWVSWLDCRCSGVRKRDEILTFIDILHINIKS